MHLLFLDESGQLAEKKFFALGGIALRDSDWPFLRELWQSTLAEHGWPADREVKWHGIRTGEVPPALADAVVAALARAPVTCYVTLLEIELGLSEAPEFFATDEDTYATGLMFLAERFQHLLAAEDDLGMIVVDSRFREDDARLRRFFADLTQDGTPYSKLDRIVEGLFLGPSHYSIGLQCADLVVRDHRGRRAGRTARRAATSGRCCPGSRAIRQQANSTGSGSNASRSRFAGRGRRPGCSNRLPSSGA